MQDLERLKAVMAELKKPFRPEEHEERKLPGGGKWFFIPWQLVRDRVEQVVPDYELEFYDPQFVGHLCTIRCRMTICGVTRIELGNAETDKSGGRGTPVECAKADAYKNAAEAWGVAAYLDAQSADKREFTAKYLQSKGDGRAAKFVKENDWQRQGLPASTGREAAKPATVKPAPPKAAPDIAPQDPNCITREQQKRLFAIGAEAGYTKEGLKLMVKINGFDSSAAITRVIYKDICEAAGDPTQATHWNAEAIGTWEQTA